MLYCKFASDAAKVNKINEIKLKFEVWSVFAATDHQVIAERRYGPIKNIGLFVDDTKLVVCKPTPLSPSGTVTLKALVPAPIFLLGTGYQKNLMR
jgi:hypothetical protein